MVVAPSWALGTLQQSTLTLNELYPDADTRAHDERMRRKREARAEEWWRDIEGMVRSPNENDALAAETDDSESQSARGGQASRPRCVQSRDVK